MRRAVATGAAACLATALSATQPWALDSLDWAKFAEPTARYPHGVLGDTIEYGALVLHYAPGGAQYTIRLPQERVFEALKPRLVDVDGDGAHEAMVVESHRDKGARLAIYNGAGLIAATPYIGTRNRWLAPLGAADLDGDGQVEVAYVDRPHLAKVLRVWRFKDGALSEVASAQRFSNHKIGWDYIVGGLRDCGGGPEMILATGNWSHVVAATFDGTALITHELDQYNGPESVDAALTCP